MEAILSAVEEARRTMNERIGGPFGAAITDREGNVIAVSSNRVLGDCDPTAHAEILAIREACRKLRTHDLTGYVMHATGYPCPMCLGAMIWANIEHCYYGASPRDAEAIGFRDEFIYEFIRRGCEDAAVLRLEQIERERCVELFREYHETGKVIY